MREGYSFLFGRDLITWTIDLIASDRSRRTKDNIGRLLLAGKDAQKLQLDEAAARSAQEAALRVRPPPRDPGDLCARFFSNSFANSLLSISGDLHITLVQVTSSLEFSNIKRKSAGTQRKSAENPRRGGCSFASAR